MWQSAYPQIQQGKVELDPYLQGKKDARRGITLLARIQGRAAEQINAFVQQLRAIEPQQYAYPSTDFHITVMSIVSCYSGYQFDNSLAQKYQDLVNQALKGSHQFSIEFSGITASSGAVMICGFVMDNQLANIRDNLRELAKTSKLENSLDARYPIKTAHSTVFRLCHPLQNAQQFSEYLNANKTTLFGRIQVERLELVVNDWYQTQTNTSLIDSFSLCNSNNNIEKT